LTAFSSLGTAGLFHPTGTCGIPPFRAFPSRAAVKPFGIRCPRVVHVAASTTFAFRALLRARVRCRPSVFPPDGSTRCSPGLCSPSGHSLLSPWRRLHDASSLEAALIWAREAPADAAAELGTGSFVGCGKPRPGSNRALLLRVSTSERIGLSLSRLPALLRFPAARRTGRRSGPRTGWARVRNRRFATNPSSSEVVTCAGRLARISADSHALMRFTCLSASCTRTT
jgi:hypothetical protein